jgi:small subunit ribosomal protein S4e
MHLKRPETSKIWPISRKGTKYLVVPSHFKNYGIPLLVVLRDVLKIVKTRKELVKILREGQILVNDEKLRDESRALVIFDNISIPALNKYYRVNFSDNGKIGFDEISEKESHYKTVKLSNKKILGKGITQLNFSDGRNIISKDKISVGDSALISFKDKKLTKVMPITDKSNVMIISGKHRGTKGIINLVGDRIFVKSKDIKFEIGKKELIVIE